MATSTLKPVTSIAYAEADAGSVGVARREETGTRASGISRSRFAATLRNGAKILQNINGRLPAQGDGVRNWRLKPKAMVHGLWSMD